MQDSVLMKVSYPIMELNEIPYNHVLYSRSIIENKVIPFAHNLPGELNPNLEERFDIYYPDVALLIDKIYIINTKDDNKETVWIDISVLDTPCGRLLKNAIEENLHIKFSLRSIANSTKLEGFEIIHENGFDFITVDAYVSSK